MAGRGVQHAKTFDKVGTGAGCSIIFIMDDPSCAYAGGLDVWNHVTHHFPASDPSRKTLESNQTDRGPR
jgi:hypothetical protein